MTQITLLDKIEQRGLTCCTLPYTAVSLYMLSQTDSSKNRAISVVLIVSYGCFWKVGLIFVISCSVWIFSFLLCACMEKKNQPYCPKVDLPSFQKVVDTLTVRVVSFYLSKTANKFSKDCVWGGAHFHLHVPRKDKLICTSFAPSKELIPWKLYLRGP